MAASSEHGSEEARKGFSLSRKVIDLWPQVTIDEWLDPKWQLSNRLTSLAHLEKLLDLSREDARLLKEVIDTYNYAVTPYYLSLIDFEDANDPIMKQCLPDPREILFSLPGSDPDPLAEHRHMPVPGLIHRYPDRALVMVSSACSVYCRHCNRKRTWSRPEAALSSSDKEKTIEYVAKNPGIREVILSGGDPLLLPLGQLEQILASFSRIPHVEVLRIGTRVPVVLPMAVTDELCDMVARYRPIWINTHFNHPREITALSQEACDRFLRRGIPVSNQSVLLKGINDSLETMLTLCQELERIMVRPYYLFHCDSVKGTDHFRTSIKKGVDIIERMWCRSGGLSIPRFVVDLPSGGGKALVTPSYMLDQGKDEAIFRTFDGRIVRYPCPNGAE